jgi:hypothetical protein
VIRQVENGKFLTSEEACVFLGISPQGLSNLVGAGRLSNYSRKLGRRVYYLESDLTQLLELQKNDRQEAA